MRRSPNAPAAERVRPATAPLRILIVRTSAIGDIVFASPIAAALRRAYPHAHIAWLVESGLEQLIAADPAVDQVMSWPRRQWASLRKAGRMVAWMRAVKAFRDQLHAQRFDLALDLQGLLKSGLLTRLSGAPQRLGLGSREGSALLMTGTVEIGGPIERISSEYLHFAQRLGLEAGDFVPSLYTADAQRNSAAGLLRERGVHEAYAVCAPFTTRAQKHWFEDAWQALAPQIVETLGLRPVMLGGPADRDAAARIAAGAPQIVDLVGRTSLGEAAAMIEGAALVIGVDTGLTHMGIGFDRPTVAIFGSTRPYLDTGRRNAEVIWLGMNCSPCRRHPTCNGAFTCLRDIRPPRVLEAARRVLAVEPVA